MQLPKGSQSLVFIQKLRWIFTPMSFMDECAKKHGDIFSLRFSKNKPTLVLVSNPQAMQEILTNDTKKFSAPGSLNKDFKKLLGKNSLIAISGKQHQRQRQLLVPPFHGEKIRNYAQIVSKVTQEVISQWQIGQPFCVLGATRAITLRVIMQAVFGLYDTERAKELEKLLGELLETTSSPIRTGINSFPLLRLVFGNLTPAKKIVTYHQQIDNLLYAEIQERRNNPDPSRSDILSLLMAARDENGEFMTDEELRDELMTLLVAGHETTATAIAWALYWIHKTPRVREKLLQELDSLGENPDSSAIVQLPYLTAVCNEALRIHPVGIFTLPRQVEKPLSLGNLDLEPGTVVVGSIYLIHRREDIYPNPESFQPERFLNKQFSPYEFLPFGGGVRRCIGSAFALFEMKLVLAKILHCTELELVNRRPVKVVKRGLVSGPSQSIRMIFKGQRQVKARKLVVGCGA